jgi:hypothetical protein
MTAHFIVEWGTIQLIRLDTLNVIDMGPGKIFQVVDESGAQYIGAVNGGKGFGKGGTCKYQKPG